MTSCYQVITLALSKLGISGSTKSARSEDLELGLVTLQALYRGLIDSGSLGRARSVVIDGEYTARENDRILRRIGATGDIHFPETVQDRVGLPSCGWLDNSFDYGAAASFSCVRPPRDGAFIVVNDAASGKTVEAIYSGYTNSWTTISDLSLDDDTQITDAMGVLLETRTSVAPLSANLNGLAARLALDLADHFGAEIFPATLRQANRFEQALVQGLGDSERPTPTYF